MSDVWNELWLVFRHKKDGCSLCTEIRILEGSGRESGSNFRIKEQPPEVQENPYAFKWVDGAWMHVIDAPEYTLSVPQKYRSEAARRWPE